jgi:hypothetical protein
VEHGRDFGFGGPEGDEIEEAQPRRRAARRWRDRTAGADFDTEMRDSRGSP